MLIHHYIRKIKTLLVYRRPAHNFGYSAVNFSLTDVQELLLSPSRYGLLRGRVGADSAPREPITDRGHRSGTEIT